MLNKYTSLFNDTTESLHANDLPQLYTSLVQLYYYAWYKYTMRNRFRVQKPNVYLLLKSNYIG